MRDDSLTIGEMIGAFCGLACGLFFVLGLMGSVFGFSPFTPLVMAAYWFGLR